MTFKIGICPNKNSNISLDCWKRLNDTMSKSKALEDIWRYDICKILIIF